MRNFMGFERTECKCDLCAMNCRFIPGYLLPEDLTAMASFLGYSELPRFAAENLLASVGALVAKAGRLFRIRTIVPARDENGCCRFFDGKLCKIHSVAPFGCAFFDSHQDPIQSHKLSALGLISISEQWRNESHSIYCRIWHHLHCLGYRAPSPEECRRRMYMFCAPPD